MKMCDTIARMVACAGVAAAMLLAPAALMPRATGQDLGIHAPAQDAPVVIVNATIHTMAAPGSGNGATRVIEKGFITFDQGKISKIGSMSDAPIFTASTVSIDAAGRHVYPGLISPYSQLGLVETAAVRASRDTSETGGITPEARALSSVNPDSTFFPVTRLNGVMLGATFPSGGIISGRPGVIRMDGWTWEQMTVSPEVGGPDLGVFVQWPMMRVIKAWWMETSEEEQRKQIAENAGRVRKAFEVARGYAARREADPATAIDVRWEAMRGLFGGEGVLAKQQTFVQAADYDQIAAAVELARDFKLRLVIVGGHDALLAKDLLKRENVPVILTCVMDLPRRDDAPYDDFFSLPGKLKEAGLLFAIASGDETAHERNLPYAAAMASAHGLAADDALRAITIDAAKILNIDARYGSLEVGKSATLILTTGSPLEVTTQTDAAFIDGRRITLTSKQTELAEKFREKYKQQPRK
jgi:imidazolonepropionase-like amidohydrolase